jgi:hypothetical protein
MLVARLAPAMPLGAPTRQAACVATGGREERLESGRDSDYVRGCTRATPGPQSSREGRLRFGAARGIDLLREKLKGWALLR